MWKNEIPGFILMFFSHFITLAQHNPVADNPFIESFKQIKPKGDIITCYNSLPVNNFGGHVQGVQTIERDEQMYIIITGSSDSYSYFAVLKASENCESISVNKILDKPYKHAGGFQVYKNLMAIGVEDNEAKDKSKVLIYDIQNPKNIPVKPLTVIERKGPYKRATAGCVGITQYKNTLLMVVGDWDSRHLDFYTAPIEGIEKTDLTFTLVSSLDMESASRQNWTDPSWLSYQNINLFTDEKDQMYLIGMTSDENNTEIADLFEIAVNSMSTFSLKKISTLNLKGHKNTLFRWGSGVEYRGDRSLRIISTSENLTEHSTFIIYR